MPVTVMACSAILSSPKIGAGHEEISRPRYLPSCYRRHICEDQAVCDGFCDDADKAKDVKMAEIGRNKALFLFHAGEKT